jgi:hypothetical protein
VLAVIDAAEAERTSERVTRAKLQRAQLGLWHGGRTPFGYIYSRSSDGRLALAVDPARAAMVREACRRVSRGDSLASIARDWNRRGMQTQADAPWRSQNIRNMLVKPASAGMNERNGVLYPGQWPAILSRKQWDAARALLLDPRRDTRSFRQVAKRYPLGGLLFCGLCDRQLVSNPLRGVPSFICSPTARGGCGKIRIQADYVERYLLERIGERDTAALETPVQARIRTALRQLQDDYYDGLLDRADFLRQSQRLRTSLSARRDGPASVGADDAERRAVFTRALEQVVVHPQPAGRAASHLNWEQRSSLLEQRLRIIWAGTA